MGTGSLQSTLDGNMRLLFYASSAHSCMMLEHVDALIHSVFAGFGKDTGDVASIVRCFSVTLPAVSAPAHVWLLLVATQENLNLNIE